MICIDNLTRCRCGHVIRIMNRGASTELCSNPFFMVLSLLVLLFKLTRILWLLRIFGKSLESFPYLEEYCRIEWAKFYLLYQIFLRNLQNILSAPGAFRVWIFSVTFCSSNEVSRWNHGQSIANCREPFSTCFLMSLAKVLSTGSLFEVFCNFVRTGIHIPSGETVVLAPI